MGIGDHLARALIVAAWICAAWPAAAQTPPGASAINAIDAQFVRVVASRTIALEAKFDLGAETELGFGLIVGMDREGRPILATARHVVASDEGATLLELRARFEPNAGLAATSGAVLAPLPDAGEDFAFVRLDQPRGAFGALPLMPAQPAPERTPVIYLGAGQQWAPAAVRGQIDPKQELAGVGEVRIAGLIAPKGSSGAPVLGPGLVLGIASRARSDGTDAIRIERLKAFFDTHFAPSGARWLLTKAPAAAPIGKITLTRSDSQAGAMRLIPTTPKPPLSITSGEPIFAPADSYTLQAGQPDSSGNLSGLSCFPAIVEVRAFQELSQIIACERDLAGRWKSTAPNGYIFTFRKTGMKSYAVAMTQTDGRSAGAANATIAANDTVTLSGVDNVSGPFSATLNGQIAGILQGEALVGMQKWPLMLVRQ